MKAYTYIDKGHFALLEKPEPRILDPKDAIVTTPEECTACTGAYGAPLGGADVVCFC